MHFTIVVYIHVFSVFQDRQKRLSYASVRMCKRGIYGSVFVRVCVCVCRPYSCSRINEMQVRVSIGFYSHVFLDFIRGFTK